MRHVLLLVITLGVLAQAAYACVSLSDPSTWGGYLANVSPSNRSFYVVNNITLCSEDITIPTAFPLFIVNQSNTEINLNGSTIRGIGHGNGVLSNYSGTVLRNGTFVNFATGISIFDVKENSNTVGWTFTENPSNFADIIFRTAVDQDGNYVVAGVDQALGSTNARWEVKKILANGTTSWTFVDNPTNNQDMLYAAAVDNDGNYIFGGYDSQTNAQWRVVKLSANGSRIWNWSYNPSANTDYVNSIAVDNDGNYIAGGIDYTPGNNQWRVIKLSPQGSVIWNWTQNPSIRSDILTSVAADQEGNYVIAGYDYGISPSDNQWRVVKVSRDGTTMWSWTQNPSAGIDNLNSVAVDLEGNYVAVGYDSSLVNNQWRVVKISRDGTTIWNWTQNPSSGTDILTSIAVDQGGNYIIGGYDNTNGNLGYSVIALSPSGTLLWQWSTNPTPNTDLLMSVSVDPEGNYVVGGYSSPTGNAAWHVIKIATDKTALTGVELSDISVLDSNMSTFVSLPNADASAYNLSIGYDNAEGIVSYASASGIENVLSNNRTILLRPDFVSLDPSYAPSFSAPANITLRAPLCTDGSSYIPYRKAGFPQSSQEILDAYTKYPPLGSECVTPTTFRFGVDSFSGYALGYNGCIDLGNSLTWTGNLVNVSSGGWMFYVVNNITLCTQDLDVPTVSHLFRVNRSATTINLNGSTLRGSGLGTAISSGSSDTVVGNGTFVNFAPAVSIFDIDDASYTEALDWPPEPLIGNITDLAVDLEGNYIVGGRLWSPENRLYLAKISPGGTTIMEWEYNYTGSADEVSVAVDPAGNYIAGVSIDEGGVGDYAIYLFKLDQYGNEIFNLTINPHVDKADFLSDIAVDAEGNYVLSMYGHNESLGWYVGCAIKLTPSGAEIWKTCLANRSEFYSIAVDPAGDYIACGNTHTGSIYDSYAVKLSKSGTVLWDWKGGHTGPFSYFYSVALDNNGNYVLGGYDTDGGDSEFVVSVLLPNGSVANTFTYDLSTLEDYLYSVEVDQDGNYVLAGMSYDSTDYAWVLQKIKPDGTVQFTYIRNPTPGDENALSVAVDYDGNYVVGGFDYDDGVSDDLLRLVKLETDKNVLGGIRLVNVSIYDENMSTYVALPGANAEISDFTIGYNSTAGTVNYLSLSGAGGTLSSNRTVLFRPDFVAIDGSALPSFSAPANITLLTSGCTSPTKYTVYRLAGLPQSREDIIRNGTAYAHSDGECLSTSLFKFGVSSFSGYAINETIIPTPPTPSGGSKKAHTLYVLPIATVSAKANTPLPLNALVQNTGDYPESNVTVTLSIGGKIVDSYTISLIAKGDVGNATLNVPTGKVGEFKAVVNASNQYASSTAEFTLIILPQCVASNDCTAMQSCVDGVCNDVVCPDGYVQNHMCVKHQCVEDSDCVDDEVCRNKSCAKLICGQFEKAVAHVCRQIYYELNITEETNVGEYIEGLVLADGAPAAGAPLKVLFPDGSVRIIYSDSSGKFSVLASLTGKYTITISNVSEDTIAVDKKSPVPSPPGPKEPQPTSQPGKGIPAKCCLIGICYELFGICWYYWVLLAVLIAVLWVIYKSLRNKRRNGWGGHKK